jgi:tetratricopeptide (TPR) repeat protein
MARLCAALAGALLRAADPAARAGRAIRARLGVDLVAQGLAAHGRGNADAAVALLREAFEAEPADLSAAAAFWDVALSCGRGAEAAPAAVRMIEHHAQAGAVELAAQCFGELAGAAPDVFASSAALLRLLPELRRRAGTTTERDRAGARDLLVLALRQAADPGSEGLTPGLALRLFEQAREFDPESARRAARIALSSPDLHEAKRARLLEWMAGQRRTSEPAEVPAAAGPGEDAPRELPPPSLRERGGELKVVGATPLAVHEDGLEVRFGLDRRALLRWRQIEAAAVVEVAGLGDGPVLLVDLVSNWSRHGEEPLRVARLRADRFDARALAPGSTSADDALRRFLADLLARSGAIPLPDRDSALGLRVYRFASAEAYEDEVLRGA